LLLFDDAEAPKPSRVISLDPRANRTYHYWHVFVPGVTVGQIYAYRVAGPVDPARGSRFDPDKVLLDSLRWWVSEMHVDGFRFDLASILSRDPQGRPMASPPILWDIESDPVLANAKLIAEAWDAAGLFQVGTFVGDSWTEWNGRFRDDVRAFLKGDNGTVRSLAFRLTGSPDVYEREEREAEQSVNFVTCHDGFMLNDLVSFNNKHNEANGERNRDGADHNHSWNCGTEGPTADPTSSGYDDVRSRISRR
jgi:pullulanase/glycogen debranching enzyme